MKASDVRKLIKPIDRAYSEMFSGRVYKVGRGAVSVRNHSSEAEQTVIGVHGFLENHCYFTQAYDDPSTELILLTCSNYHIPVNGITPEKAPWEVPIKHLEATIEYDAAMLNQALANLPTTQRVRVHGHSRGGAVILEGVRQWPDLYDNVEVVLEAPVLPQGRLHPLVTMLLEPVSHGMWPWLIRLINSAPASTYGQTFFGRMNPRKKQLLSHLFSATQDHLTIVRNLENLMAWMERNNTDLYQNIRHGTFLIPQVDRILDRGAMLDSARQSPTTMRIIETQAPSHFITLDSKSWIPSLESVPTAVQA
ncbi:pimeloyl-ACP methyl ester carboxylesterase [Tamilnaduibacter salinus]|uniref:Alpha/beta hydrolase n=1 Tax=Tamilnaduibacter salinus TaxID=1484056 RepID=A0A2A2I249_9GAMM|nr:alpha/beta hydrolase [Tamilnaduibacter salinus]PAV25364.1 alpha/beta hydrolase [Tamilnaduibacter salinus]PVY75981.1 pimeloyl-ACP methyl ester carboxylesterase [Tamilnaduibacter salinus]